MTTQLTREQFRQFLLALCDAFRSKSALEQMILLGLGEQLNVIINVDQGLGNQAFDLLQWAHSRGRVDELITAACKANPGNPALREFVSQLISDAKPDQPASAAPKERQYKILAERNFDLSFIPRCVGHVRTQDALCGFTIGCDALAFRTSFCERLAELVGRGTVEIIDHLTITPLDTVDGIQWCADQIGLLRENLQTGDQFYVVRLKFENRRKVGERAKELWSALQTQFQGSYNYRLIIVLVSEFDFVPPPGMMRLDPPRFSTDDLFVWIKDVAPALGWEERYLMDWHDKIKLKSAFAGKDELRVESTYWYLSRSLKLLRKQPPPLPDEFLAEL